MEVQNRTAHAAQGSQQAKPAHLDLTNVATQLLTHRSDVVGGTVPTFCARGADFAVPLRTADWA